MKKSKKRKLSAFTIFNAGWMILFALYCLLPMMIMISASISTDKAIQEFGFTIFPKEISWQAYKVVFRDGMSLLRAYGVSLFVTLFGTVFSLILTALIAYPLSKEEFAFRKPITGLILFTQLFSAGLVPTYILITQYLGWRDSLLALIIPGLGGPFYIILMRTFFKDIPRELSESAKIDGCSEMKIFLKIVLPLSKPVIATSAVLFSLNYWNDWYSSFLYIDDRNSWTVQYLMIKLANEAQAWKTNASLAVATEGADSIVMATCLIGTVPVMIIFMFLQKYIVKGMTVGAVKG